MNYIHLGKPKQAPKLLNQHPCLILCLYTLVAILSFSNVNAQETKSEIQRIDPPNWWTQMENKELNLLVKCNQISGFSGVNITPSGISVLSATPSENNNYLHLKLLITDDAKPGVYNLAFNFGRQTVNFKYELLQRKSNSKDVKGINQSDLIYLIMPDRFSNANPSNDMIYSFNQRNINRDSILCRHGGDILGIINHLDYVNDLGATAIWLNPVQENNQPKESYHGYAITDHYQIDKRLGSLDDYNRMVKAAHDREMKVIMDIVFNHTGNEHYLYKEQPSADWFHQFKQFTRTNYRATSIMDPYASEYDKNLMQNAWFDKHMPDLNQKNEHLANYLITNSIWWIETTGINGFRVDTWAYPDQDFMKAWTAAIRKEYPQFTIFGEVWEHGPAIQAQFAKNIYSGKYHGEMPGIIDFELYYAINNALTKDFGWTEGAASIYYTLAQDFLYQQPQNNVIFLDNHDLSRFTSMIDGNMDKFKSGINFLLTTRGIPSLFYGTEILMKAWSNPDAKVRIDFPGGWPSDSLNKFNENGRNTDENEAFNHIKKLSAYRKKCKAITEGTLIQFVPENGLYVYFRQYDNQKVMVIMNTLNKNIQVDTSRYNEVLKDCQYGLDIINNRKLERLNDILLKPYESIVIELFK